MYATLTDATGRNVVTDGTVPVSGTLAVSSISDPVTIRGDPVDCNVDEYSTGIDDTHSQEVLAENSARVQMIIANLGTGAGDFAYLSYGGTASPSHLILGPGEKLMLPPGFKITQAINMIAATGKTMTIYAAEWTTA
jgi:hypothetical protein